MTPLSRGPTLLESLRTCECLSGGVVKRFQLQRVVDSVDDPYVDGVSLTHGAAGLRQHIWSFAAAVDTNYRSAWNCACTNTNESWPFQNCFPSFVGSNYFCATGNEGPRSPLTQFHSEDPLWDGEGCGSTNTCCQLNSPPWLCITLPRATMDDIELTIRIMTMKMSSSV